MAPAPASSRASAGPASDPGSAPTREHRGRRAALSVLAVAGAAVALRLPLVGRPLSPDEAGYLLVAAQAGPGGSLYGDHWVDRPPLLLAVYLVADRLGGAVGLRLVGLLVVVVAVLAAGALGAAAAGRSRGPVAAVLGATAAALFLATPLFGTTEVNGELLAAPLVLGGAALLLAAVRAGPATRPGLLALTGAAGTAAVLVKQNQWDVWVLLVALVVARRGRAAGLGPASLPPFLVGAAAAAATALAVAAALGAGPAGLWDAVVVFRAEAAAVVASSASAATGQRLVDLVVAFLVSGAPLVLALLLLVLRRPPAPGALDLRLPVLAVLAWEAVAVLGGASYWPPYLVCTVTGLVLATVVVAGAAGGPVLGLAPVLAARVPLAWAALACVVSTTWVVAHPPARPQDDVVAWLRSHAAPGDDAVVAYGHPDVLHGAGLESPYPHLWSLPVRVRDPALGELAAVLGGPRAPDWVVLTGPTLATWGIDDSAGTRVLDRRYTPVAVVGRYTVYRLEAQS